MNNVLKFPFSGEDQIHDDHIIILNFSFILLMYCFSKSTIYLAPNESVYIINALAVKFSIS